jgi:hypothetical protein
VAQWLHDYIGGIDSHFNEDNAFVRFSFRLVCLFGHLTVAQWLYELGANVHVNEDATFRAAYRNGDLLVAQWLYNLGGIPTKVLRTFFESRNQCSDQLMATIDLVIHY